MGRDRATIRWEVHRQMLLEELQRLERAQAASGGGKEASATQDKLIELRARVQAMGPSPQAKMG
jgi:hypothetical protein